LYKLEQVAFENQGIVEDNKMIQEATRRYKLSQDKVQQFIDEMIVHQETIGEKVSKTHLAGVFKRWMELKFKYSLKAKELFDVLDKTYDSNTKYYQGFELKDSYDDGEDSEEIVTKEDKFITACTENFEVTNNPKDRVLRSSIQEWASVPGFGTNLNFGYRR
jgi:phage/plasmid-associated DNA primase